MSMSATTKCIGLFFFLLSLCPLSARAITIEPSSNDLSVMPGASDSVVFLLANNDLQPKTYHLDVVAVSIDETSDAPSFYNLPTSLSSWVSVDPAIISLESQTASEITLTLTPPADASPRVQIFGLRAVADGEGAGSVSVREGIIGLLFVTVGAGQEGSGELIDFTVSEGGLTNQFVTFYITVTNTGETVIKPSGTISIQNIFGQLAETLEVNPDQKRLVPGQTRTLAVSWQPKFATGFYGADLNFDETSLVSGQGHQSAFVVSWRLLLVCLFIFGVVLIVWGRRRKKQA